MKQFKRNISRLLIAVLFTLSAHAVDLPVISNTTSTTVYAKQSSKGRFEGHIDRLTLPDYAKNFYDDLYANSQDINGYLIDTSKCEKITSKYIYPGETSRAHAIYVSRGERVYRSAEVAQYEILNIEAKKTKNYLLALQAFVYDHPEVFWLNTTPLLDYTFELRYNYSTGAFVYEFKLYFNYDYMFCNSKYFNKSTLVKAINKKDKLLNKLSKKLKKKDSYKTVLAITDYLTAKNEYNSYIEKNLAKASYLTTSQVKKFTKAATAANDGLIALEGHKGKKGPVCGSYASAFKMLCDKLNIPCVRVVGLSKSYSGVAGGHMWNIVKMDNNTWYDFDPTWNDNHAGLSRHAFACVGEDTKIRGLKFKRTHYPYNKRMFPQLPSSAYNFKKKMPKISKTKYKASSYSVKLKKSTFTYNGKAKKPKVVVTDNKNKKINKKKYKVIYKSNVNPGYGKTIIKFKNKKIKSQTIQFTIKPAKVKNVKLTLSGNVANLSFAKQGASNGVEIRYSTNNKFDLNNSHVIYSKTNTASIPNLNAGKTYTIKIRSYVRVDGKYIYSDYSSFSTVAK